MIIGATPEGKKELVGFADGVRESAQSWRDLLLDLKRRGLSTAPQLAVADGALGFWKALGEIWPSTREQRCWVHKTANVLNKLPKSLHGKAKRALQDIWMAETKNDAVAALDAFAESYAPKYEKAVECLTKDRDVLLAFFDFPAEHWKHLRSTNPIESTFATVRHRTIRSKGCLSNKTALAMVFKLIEAAQKSWRCLDGHNQLPKLITGVKFADGIEVVATPTMSALMARTVVLISAVSAATSRISVRSGLTGGARLGDRMLLRMNSRRLAAGGKRARNRAARSASLPPTRARVGRRAWRISILPIL